MYVLYEIFVGYQNKLKKCHEMETENCITAIRVIITACAKFLTMWKYFLWNFLCTFFDISFGFLV